MHFKSALCSTFKHWLPLAVVTVLLTGLIYVAVQQNYRLSANDPQIQASEDVIQAISQGTPPDSLVPSQGTLDLAKTLDTFAMTFDQTGKTIGSSVLLDGKNPTVPSGVFDTAKKKGSK